MPITQAMNKNFTGRKHQNFWHFLVAVVRALVYFQVAYCADNESENVEYFVSNILGPEIPFAYFLTLLLGFEKNDFDRKLFVKPWWHLSCFWSLWGDTDGAGSFQYFLERESHSLVRQNTVTDIQRNKEEPLLPRHCRAFLEMERIILLWGEKLTKYCLKVPTLFPLIIIRII